MITLRLCARLMTVFILVLTGCEPDEKAQGFIGYVEAELLYVAAPSQVGSHSITLKRAHRSR